VKRPVTHRARLLTAWCARYMQCGVSSHQCKLICIDRPRYQYCYHEVAHGQKQCMRSLGMYACTR